jgi:mono/diheme cytochrome c family protein
MNPGTFLFLLLVPVGEPKGRLEIEAEELKPGVVAEYRSQAEPKIFVTRIEAKPAFTLGRSNPHPRLPVGPFEVVYRGVISLRDPGPISFSAFVGGEVTMIVDDVTVLEGRGTSETSQIVAKNTIERPGGYYRFELRYRSIADVPARLQVWWKGPSFIREPIPAWRLGHVESELLPAAKQEQLAMVGRSHVGRFGCARCHASAFPSVDDPPPGPSLADVGQRLSRRWLMNWLADPAKVLSDAHMPALFSADRAGYVERWLVADSLSGGRDEKRVEPEKRGDFRAGRLAYLGLGCAACHLVPDVDRAEQSTSNRTLLSGLANRYSPLELEAFLKNPHARYPDGRMPRLPVTADEARNIVAYLFLWSKPTELAAQEAPTAAELQEAIRRLGARDARSAATNLLTSKGCVSCHTGLGDAKPRDVPIKKLDAGCLGETGPKFAFDASTREAIAKYLAIASTEKHASPFAARQQKLKLAGCTQCHSRDSDRLSPLEEAGSKLGGAFLQELPFLRTPRLTYPHQKLTRSYLATTVREGNPNLRWSRYSYKMPAFGAHADELLQAIAEGDGELVTEADPPIRLADDPTLGTLHGPRLAGFQGYACASCHVWDGKLFGSPDPVATGPDLTRTAGRLRRDWFDKYLESPLRFYPGTPMPAIFPHGKPATLNNILEGDPAKQKDALWAYFAKGKDAPSPKPPPPVPVDSPTTEDAPLVAQIPIRVNNKPVESISLLSSANDLLIYDLAIGSPTHVFNGGRILRNVQGRIRQFVADGEETGLVRASELLLSLDNDRQALSERVFLGYDSVDRGFRVHWKLRFGSHEITCSDEILIQNRELKRRIEFYKFPKDASLIFKSTQPLQFKMAEEGEGSGVFARDNDALTIGVSPNKAGHISLRFRLTLPKESTPPKWDLAPPLLNDASEGSLIRPGYRAIAYPRAKTVSGEDRVMPSAVAVRPKDGQVFVASLKTGELFALRDPTGDGKNARFERYGNGLYQDALSMLAEDDGLYVLHRRNLTKILERGDRFERIAALPHGIADTYDMAYGLARDKEGRFVFGYAPYANQTMPGSGGVLRLKPGKPPEEVAYGLRNALGWCAGPEGEVFFTDNQGDWVAANKLCHIVEGRYYGWPNRSQQQHTTKPAGKTTIWVPYTWARSINGVAYDNTSGKFGPFAGQFFMAELMFGGAIIRANVEKVNGVYQGGCFPFWGKGLLGPVTLAFDPRGKLYVGGITEPGWMAQPDRGALFRIDYTGQMPFEMQSIHARPSGFRIVFTSPVDRKTAEKSESYRLEHYRYEYTGAYGSPELDRTAAKVERVVVAAGGLSAELTTSPLVKERVYMITGSGVRSEQGAKLVNPTGAYTLNEVPSK